jgi:hypothetical protein
MVSNRVKYTAVLIALLSLAGLPTAQAIPVDAAVSNGGHNTAIGTNSHGGSILLIFGAGVFGLAMMVRRFN